MATTPTTLFEDLKTALTDFKKFIDENFDTIKSAIIALRSIFSEVSDLLTMLVELLTKIKAEVDKLASTPIPGMDKVTNFTNGVKTLLETAEKLLPDEKSAIDEVKRVADVVTSIPSLADIQAEIDGLIDYIIGRLNELNA